MLDDDAWSNEPQRFLYTGIILWRMRRKPGHLTTRTRCACGAPLDHKDRTPDDYWTKGGTPKSRRTPGTPKCRPDQIVNPRTNRCVSKHGKIGQELLSRNETVQRGNSRSTALDEEMEIDSEEEEEMAAEEEEMEEEEDSERSRRGRREREEICQD